ncbi:uncharacterized mitochondrial protein AtMg01250-like [Lactuca sativa]|uniref:uncharacterized mitochondrial protein AtMg01250-like n=1 Tax=Lactuca sativa TaxID=4236 RepID=UPI000CD7F62F|nr:uncharacterized mitochondrial protein AtMg01250-like [Lactuca sativa]
MEKLDNGLSCLSLSYASVLVNDSPTDEIAITKGVRQGDPLSPFMFIIAMEGLHIAVKSVCDKAMFHVIKIPNNCPIISHLFYADDVICAGEWDRASIKNLSVILKCFHISSGLKVNFLKSRLFGMGSSTIELQGMARVLGCLIGSFPFTYLGIHVGGEYEPAKALKPDH